MSKHNDQTNPNPNPNPNSEAKKVTLTYLEFYSGVGGWSFALKEACDNVNRRLRKDGNGDGDIRMYMNMDMDMNMNMNMSFSTKCLGAYDHSDLCYQVFDHNFPHVKKCLERDGSTTSGGDGDNSAGAGAGDGDSDKKRRKKKQKTKSSHPQRPVAIEKLSKKHLEEKKADIWMMSPPCQPHTRQHSNQKEDVNDPRSKSFLHLCDVISDMDFESLPRIILLENVIGFESVSKVHVSFILFEMKLKLKMNACHPRATEPVHSGCCLIYPIHTSYTYTHTHLRKI